MDVAIELAVELDVALALQIAGDHQACIYDAPGLPPPRHLHCRGQLVRCKRRGSRRALLFFQGRILADRLFRLPVIEQHVGSLLIAWGDVDHTHPPRDSQPI